jgi:hypothetical protein
MLGALALAIALAIGGMMMAEHRDQSFHDVESLRSFTKVPILVWCRRSSRADRRNYRRSTMRAIASIISLVFIVGAFLILPGTTNSLCGRSVKADAAANR